MACSLAFNVKRREPELVTPAEPTPHEFKPLSDFDDAPNNCSQIPGVHFFCNNPLMEGRNPASVIREALAKALTFYYPLAGRIRVGPGGKLVVECTGEGAQFIEAEADVGLELFGDDPRPPFPCLDELLYSVEGSDGLVNCPLLLIQVTRFKCGGFTFAHRINHTVSDGFGLSQFMKAMVELARGAKAPTVLPVWERELLNARSPPRVTHIHPELELTLPTDTPIPSLPADMVIRSFFLGSKEISALRDRLPPHRRSRSASSRFEVVTACAWRCHTMALGYDPDERVRVMLLVNVRGKTNPPIPAGFYGNAFAAPVSGSTAGELCSKPLGYALELIREAKALVTEGYFQSMIDAGMLMGRPFISIEGTFIVSDVSHVGLDEVDFGWGRATYAGPAFPVDNCYLMRHRNNKEEEGTLMALALPGAAMERFAAEMEEMTNGDCNNGHV